MSNETISVPRELMQHILDGGYCKAFVMEELRALLAQPAEHQGEPIRLTAVAELVDDGDGGLEPIWILEGGTAELFAGMMLLVADNAPDLCHEDGSAEVYTRPGALPAAVVLPERKITDNLTYAPESRSFVCGWNACLDEVARLNPPQQ